MKFRLFALLLFLSTVGVSQCLQGDCINGYGVLTCDCGYTFEGQFKDGMKLYGTLTKEDLVYKGGFKDDVAHGYGLIRYADGSWYEGEFAFNQPHGYGKFKFSTGETYIGQFKEGSFSGLGVLVENTSDSIVSEYEIGQFENDVLTGIGFSQYVNGDMYLGMHDRGEKNGYGIFVMPASQDAEMGLFKPSRIVKNVALVDYPDEGCLKANPLKHKGVIYESSGMLTGEQMWVSIQSDTLSTVSFFDSKQQVFFISKSNSSSGLAINMQGEIYEAELQRSEKFTLTLGKKLHAWQHDSEL